MSVRPAMPTRQVITPSRQISAPTLISLYALAALSPLLLSLLIPLRGHGPLLHTVGSSLGLVGFALILMHFVLTARLKWTEKPVGLDLLYQFHRSMAILSFLLILAHPLALAASRGHWSLLYSLSEDWYIILGRVVLLVLTAQVLLAIFRAGLKLEYQKWKLLHNGFAALVLVGGFVHTLYASGDSKSLAMRVLWSVLFTTAVAAYLWHQLGQPARLRRRPYRVTEVKQETPDVWTVSLAPKDGRVPLSYLPGQYQYLTLFQDGLPVQEHPFTFSSSPSRPGTVSATIKASGDWTKLIRTVQPGDDGWVEAPYGRFSHVLHPEERDLVFIAGGVGITPLMSMLRYIQDTQEPRRVLLLYANRSEADIIFRDELAEMERKSASEDIGYHLQVVHVLSKPDAEWSGETGRLDAGKIGRLCGDLADKSFYICGPTGLIDATAATLHEMGATPERIHFERFAW